MRRAGGPPLRDATARLLFHGVPFPGGGSMSRASSVLCVGPPVSIPLPLRPRSRTTTTHRVRIRNMRTIRAKQLLGAAVVALLCALAPAGAQGQAVSGRVIDATGKAVPGAQV